VTALVSLDIIYSSRTLNSVHRCVIFCYSMDQSPKYPWSTLTLTLLPLLGTSQMMPLVPHFWDLLDCT